ncbi:formate dehydrogenase subunit gamma [Acidithiobacillus sp.]
MSISNNLLLRYRPAERANHWLVAIIFILLALSGLAFFDPSWFWLATFFGGGPWARILHPWLGVVMMISFTALAVRMWRYNLLTANDRQWLLQIRDVVRNREERLPEVGRYNGGQKVLFWVMIACMFLLFVSGLIIWYQYFALYFPVEVRRIAVVVHAVAAFVLIAGILVHIYAAIWIRGTMGAMIRGTVSRAWAKKHHLGWYRKITGESE